jgi:hypothetical protein
LSKSKSEQSNALRRGHTGSGRLRLLASQPSLHLGAESTPRPERIESRPFPRPVIIGMYEVLLSMRDGAKRVCMRRTRRTSRSAASHASSIKTWLTRKDTYRGRDEKKQTNTLRPSAGRSRRPYDVGYRRTAQCPLGSCRKHGIIAFKQVTL